MISIYIILLLSLSTCVFSQDSKDIVVQYKGNLSLDCSDKGDDFFVYYTTKDVNGTEKHVKKEPSAEKIFLNGNQAGNILIKDLRREDIEGEYSCRKSENSDPVRTFKKQIAPFLYKPDKTSQTITEGGSVDFECKLLYGDSATWAWYKDESSNFTTDTTRIEITSNGSQSLLKIKNVLDQDKGIYKCVASNSYGVHQESIRLRVKDALAALWPFLAIVAEVVILCLIILIYEKKCNKKPATTEEENELSANLMGKDASNSDVKKRTVKA